MSLIITVSSLPLSPSKPDSPNSLFLPPPLSRLYLSLFSNNDVNFESNNDCHSD